MQPSNDLCSSATIINSLPFFFSGTTESAQLHQLVTVIQTPLMFGLPTHPLPLIWLLFSHVLLLILKKYPWRVDLATMLSVFKKTVRLAPLALPAVLFKRLCKREPLILLPFLPQRSLVDLSVGHENSANHRVSSK